MSSTQHPLPLVRDTRIGHLDRAQRCTCCPQRCGAGPFSVIARWPAHFPVRASYYARLDANQARRSLLIVRRDPVTPRGGVIWRAISNFRACCNYISTVLWVGDNNCGVGWSLPYLTTERSNAIRTQCSESSDPRVHVNRRAVHCNRRTLHKASEEAERRLKLPKCIR